VHRLSIDLREAAALDSLRSLHSTSPVSLVLSTPHRRCLWYRLRGWLTPLPRSALFLSALRLPRPRPRRLLRQAENIGHQPLAPRLEPVQSRPAGSCGRVLDKPDAFNWLPRTARQDRDRLRAELDHERQERERLVRVIEEQAAAVRSQGEQIRLLTDQRERRPWRRRRFSKG
jgi:hypothetical protein